MSHDDGYSRETLPHLVAAMRGLEDLGLVLARAEDSSYAADAADAAVMPASTAGL